MGKPYFIDRPPESRAYLRGWQVTGRHLQALFSQYNEKLEDAHFGFCWLRADIVSPTFDSMNFRFKNRVFSVLVDLMAPALLSDMEKKNHDHGYGILCRTKLLSKTTQRQRELQIEVCRDNDMIPCLFGVAVDGMRPMEKGWNIRHTETGEPVVPTEVADDTPRRISEWEMMNWGINIVMDELRQQGKTILSYTDAPGIMPQLWFEEENGDKCWVQVVVNQPIDTANVSGPMIGYKGYVAGVRIRPLNGEDAVYRSRPADVDFMGMEAVGE